MQKVTESSHSTFNCVHIVDNVKKWRQSWFQCHVVKISWDKSREIAFFLSHWSALSPECYKAKMNLFVCWLGSGKYEKKKKINICLLGMYLASSAVCFENKIEIFARSPILHPCWTQSGYWTLTCAACTSRSHCEVHHIVFSQMKSINICADKPQRFAIQVTNCIHPMDDGRCERALSKDVRWMHNECERTSETMGSCALQGCIYQ